MNMFSNGNGESLTFAKFNSKLGAFVIKNKETGEKTTFSQIRDVMVTKAGTRDGEYEGVPYTELVLRLKGKDETAQVSFNVATGACSKMVSILNNADLSKPIGLSGQLLKAGTTPKGFAEPLQNDLVSVSVFQEGWLKPSADVPKVVMVKVGNKEVADTSERDAFTAAQIAILETKVVPPTAHAAPADEPATANAGASFDDADSDYPF